MRILGWQVEGFGIFKDHEVRGLLPGLTVFHGPNEAGKSTLLAFLRGVLFGFPGARSKLPHYPPVHGGRHGGRVLLLDDDGEYTVERFAVRRTHARVTLPDGTEGTEAELRDLLGGVDATLFNSVFAFSLAELHSFETLTIEGISNRIFSAGIAGAGKDARAALERLQGRAAELLKVRGRARINDLARELVGARTQAKDALDAAGGYAALVAKEAEKAAAVERLALESAELRTAHARCSTLLTLWPAWIECREASRELETLEPTDGFPADAEIRLESALADMRNAAWRIEEARQAFRVAEERRRAIAPDPAAAAIADDLESLYQSLPLHRERLLDVPRLAEEISRARAVHDERFRALGSGWSQTRLEAFDRSGPRADAVRAWGVRLSDAAAACARARESHEAARGRVAELEVRRERSIKQLPDREPLDAERLEKLEEVVRRMRANRAELRTLEAELRAQDAVLNDRRRAYDAMSSGEGAWEPPARALHALAALAVAMLLVAVWRFVAADPAVGAACAIFAILAGGGAIAVPLLRQRARQDAARREAEFNQIMGACKDATAARDALREEVNAITAKIAADAAALSLPRLPSAHEIEELAGRIERNCVLRRAFDAAQAQVHDAEADLAAAREALVRAEDERGRAEAAAEECAAAWRAWRERVGIGEAADPAAALAIVEAARSACAAGDALADCVAHAARDERDIGEWEERARAVLARAGGADGRRLSGEALIAQVLAWRKRSLDAREAHRTMTALAEQVSDSDEAVRAAEAEGARCAEVRDRLFAEGGAADEASFRRRLAVDARRRLLSSVVQDRRRQIAMRLGGGAEAEALEAELAAGDDVAWRQRIERLDAEMDAVRRKRDRALVDHRDSELALRVLEASAGVAALEGEHRRIAAELDAAVRSWRAIVLAQGLIERTLREFERTRQPEVLAEASKTFAAVTGGRYTRVAQTEGEAELTIFDVDGHERRIDELSRGTAEQLYLCIRLGLAAELARRTSSLPLVMDDVLVNFDPERARAMAAALVEFSRGRQILFFTCHPSTRDLLRSVDETVTAIEMEMGHLGERNA